MNLLRRPNRTAATAAVHPALEARLGAGFARALNARVAAVQPDIVERLRFAREQALARAAAARAQAVRPMATAAAATAVLGGGRGAGLLGAPVSWWHRALSVLPLVLLVTGLLAIDQAALHEQVLAAADIDAQLLADDLPPAAYSDPGFAEFLRSAPPP